ncbi:MAG: hypothetical protein KBD24_01285 [Candidatus Pacebacteria bacterium]|nr:hypothetical protein [Candidatus Paceibacterota bacterium]
MTIDAIFTRYQVPPDVQKQALARGAFVLALHDVWVGPDVTWPVIVKALIFAHLGDIETSAHVRKKVGLDKYTLTLITRGVPTFADTVADSHDWHQKLYVYCLWRDDEVIQAMCHDAWQRIKFEIEANMLHEVASQVTSSLSQVTHTLRAIEVYHYKNPSV